MPSTVYSGKRGMAFENLLEYTNTIYANKGKAVISKRATPMKIISKTRMPGQHICVFDKKSTVDYDGVYQGHSIQFEAKSTQEKRFPLDMITKDQVAFLNKAEEQGAICFVLVELRALNTVFLVPNKMLQKYVKDAQSGGRKSIPLDEMEVYAWLVESKNGYPLDYLSVVDKLIESEVVS
jgi:recombination protein U